MDASIQVDYPERGNSRMKVPMIINPAIQAVVAFSPHRRPRFLPPSSPYVCCLIDPYLCPCLQ